MIDYGSRARKLPAPPGIVWDSLTELHAPGARPWLNLLDDEIEPRVLEGVRPSTVLWSSLWPSRPDDQVLLELDSVGCDTSLRFTLRCPDEPPDESRAGHLRKRMNHLLFADLRESYGQ